MMQRVHFIIVTAAELPEVNAFLERRRSERAAVDARRTYRWEMYCRDPHCAYCRRQLKFKQSTVDHIVPRSQGGTDDPENLVLCCVNCNNAKDGMTLGEWRERMLSGLLFADCDAERELTDAA